MNQLRLSPAKLKKYRLKLNMHVKHAASLVDVSPPTWYYWESGQRVPKENKYQDIAVALHTEIYELLDMTSQLLYSEMMMSIEEVMNDDSIEALDKVPLSLKVLEYIDPDAMGNIISEDDELQPGMLWDNYRHPDYHAFNSRNAKHVIQSIEEGATHIVLSGPTRTAKTLLCIDIILRKMFEVPGIQILAVRSDAVDLRETVRKSIKELTKYDLDHPNSPFKVDGGYDNFHKLTLPNGSTLVLGGMNRPGRILGTAYDIIFYSQIEMSDDEQWNKLQTRISAPAGNWVDEEGFTRYLLISDSNPERLDHYLMKLKDEGEIDWFEFGFEDNPRFFRDGKRTPSWNEVERLEKNLTGIWYERYFLGKWGNPEGLVYHLTDANFVTRAEMPDIAECDIYRAMDFGMDHPSVCLWIAVHRETKNRYVYREWRRTHTDSDFMTQQVKAFSKHETIKNTIIEIDEDREKRMKKNGIPCQPAKKGGGSVMNGIFLVQSAIRRAQEAAAAEQQAEGGFYIVNDEKSPLLCVSDPDPDVDPEMNLIKELRNMMFNENKDEPIDENDDAADAYRYFELWFANTRERFHYASVIDKHIPKHTKALGRK